MQQTPSHTTWKITCRSSEQAQALQNWLSSYIDLDRVLADTVRVTPHGVPQVQTVRHRLGDYFAAIRVLPGSRADSASFQLDFSKRSDAGRFWKDLMVDILQEIEAAPQKAAIELESKGDVEPVSNSATPWPYDQLIAYLRRRLNQLHDCQALIAQRIDHDKMAVAEQSKDPKNAERMARIFYHLEYGLARTFRYTLLIGVCSFVEESVKAIAKERVPDDKTRDETMEAKGGNSLEKHVHLFSELLGLDPAPFQADLDNFKDLITLRNCITHCWGKIEEARNPTKTREAVERIRGLEKTGNYNHVEISKDGYLVLGDDLVPHAIWTAECIVDSIITAMLNVSIT